jgi:hypothetical protein
VTLGDDVAAALLELRGEAESRMRDTCTITRPGAVVWNATTLQNDVTTVTVYSGPCRVKAAVMRDRVVTVADQSLVESQFILSLPIATSGGVATDDSVTITASAEDPATVGRMYRIIAGPAPSDATARRFPIRETQ